ncbi:hypothetical protein C8F01DRAFT_1085558 [Mycena amicta]|nr:hypothetical protein C8F01DRAFT_1085558 [Mycena amicta]
MSTEPAPAIRDAPAPFSSAHDTQVFSYPSDFILRSSDGFDFHVHREMLKLVSDCFEGMFVVSDPAADSEKDTRRDGKPVVSLTESKRILYKLLTLAYPVVSLTHFSLTRDADLDNITAIFHTAQKYQFLRIPPILQQMLDKPPLIAMHPHRMFAIARICGMTALARKAALGTLKAGAEALNVTFPEMKLLTWDDAHKINEFHRVCGVQASNCAKAMGRVYLKSGENANAPNCAINPHTAKEYVWWTEKGHSYECSSSTSTLRSNSEKKKRYSFFSRGPELLEPRAMWFRNHLQRVQERLLVVPTDVMVALAEEDKKMIVSCRICAKQAESDLGSLQCVLAEAIGDVHGRLASLLMANFTAEEMF